MVIHVERELSTWAPNRVWLADISELLTSDCKLNLPTEGIGAGRMITGHALALSLDEGTSIQDIEENFGRPWHLETPRGTFRPGVPIQESVLREELRDDAITVSISPRANGNAN